MAKITLSDLTSLANDTSAVNTINANFALIETALENEVLYRDNPSGSNVLVNDLDFDSTYDIMNCASGTFTSLTVNGVTVDAVAAAAAASASAAATSESNAATSETNAAASAASAAADAAAVDVNLSQTNVFTAAQVASTQTNASATGSVTLDFDTYNNFILTLTGSLTLANPTTENIGQAGFICLKQDATGSRTLTLGSQYLTSGGTAPTLSTSANAIDLLGYVVVGDGQILLGDALLAYS